MPVINAPIGQEKSKIPLSYRIPYDPGPYDPGAGEVIKSLPQLSVDKLEDEVPELISDEESDITTPLLGSGILRDLYQPTQSKYLLYKIPISIVKQMNKSIRPHTWLNFIHFPPNNALLNFGTWWNWSEEIPNLINVLHYLGNTLGKHETHFVASAADVNHTQWLRRHSPGDEGGRGYKLTNKKLETLLNEKIGDKEVDIIDLTDKEWEDCGIDARMMPLLPFHWIKVGNVEYSPFSPGTHSVHQRVKESMAADFKRDIAGSRVPSMERRPDECTGNCYAYITENNIARYYMNIDFGYVFWDYTQNDSDFRSLSDEEKREWLRRQLNMYIAHEYTHVVTDQIMDPFVTGRRWLDENERATSNWRIESFATMLPLFMGFKFDDYFDFEKRVETAFKDIYDKMHTLKPEDFYNKMMYEAHLNPHLPYLVTACLAQQTSWKTILVDFIFDSQRVEQKSRYSFFNSFFNRQSKPGSALDDLWLHHFGKKQKDLLQDIFAKIINGEITMASLIDVLPGGTKFGIKGLLPFDPQVVYSE